jgi:hypothetical protein
MANISGFSFILISYLLLSVVVIIEGRSHYPETMELRLCGKKLVQIIKSVCNHRYIRPSEDNFYHRVKRGIAHDCCKTKCTVGYIKKYCEM